MWFWRKEIIIIIIIIIIIMLFLLVVFATVLTNAQIVLLSLLTFPVILIPLLTLRTFELNKISIACVNISNFEIIYIIG